MRGETVNGCTWHELARCDAPLEGRVLWQALVDKTENPQAYSDGIESAELIDHDPLTVVRRTYPQAGESYIEYVRHDIRSVRVECGRADQTFRRAQALVETDAGPCLVYQVDDPGEAASSAGIDADYARGVLRRILTKARSLVVAGV